MNLYSHPFWRTTAIWGQEFLYTKLCVKKSYTTHNLPHVNVLGIIDLAIDDSVQQFICQYFVSGRF